MARRAAPWLVGFLLLGGCAARPSPPPEAVIRALAAQPAQRAALAEAARREAAALGCPDAVPLEPEPPRPWRPRGVAFASGGRPVELGWLQGIPLSFCPVTSRLVALVTVPAGAPVQTGIVQVGRTLADPQLQTDVLRQGLRPLLSARFAECPTARVVDTEVTRAPATPGAEWEEMWLVAGCGRALALGVAFRPTGARTDFALRETVEGG